MMNKSVIRPAAAGESGLLTEITYRSKAHWGYDEAFMAVARPQMAITEAMIANGYFSLLEIDGQVAGYCSLESPVGEAITLENLFIEPAFIGKGCGEQLLRHAMKQAIELGYHRLEVVSDPNAEGFYRKMGGVRTGETPGATPGRFLPTLRFELDQFRERSFLMSGQD